MARIIPRRNLRPLAGQINAKPLSQLLKFFEVRPRDKWYRLATADEQTLWDLYEQARDSYWRQIKHLHPDRGGNALMAALLNDAWRRVKLLFQRRGIGI